MDSRLVARLILPTAVVSGLLLVLAGGAAWYIRNLQRTTADLLTNNVASVRAAQELEISIREVRTQFDRYLITGERRHLEPVDRLKQRTADALTEADRLATTPTEQLLMRRTRAGYAHFFAEYELVLHTPPPQGFYPKLAELIDAVLTKEILEPAHEYLRVNEVLLSQISQENRAVADRLTAGLVGLGVCGAGGGLLAGWAIAAAVRRSVARTESWLRDTATELALAVPPTVEPAVRPADTLERVSASVSAVLRRLKQSERDALRAEQLAWVGQMAAGVAHEVRNPLMAIKLLIQAAADRPGGAAFSGRDMRVLEEEIVRLEAIVSGFLDFARPPRPLLLPVDAMELVGKVVGAVRGRAELQGVHLVIETSGTPPPLSADPGQLRQVLLNLLFNALDAQPLGGRICIQVAPGPSGRDVLITVADNGPGLPAGLGDRIFEPFVSTKDTGLGLGLSICRRIVTAHSGELTAADRPGGGAVVSIRLPAAHIALATRR